MHQNSHCALKRKVQSMEKQLSKLVGKFGKTRKDERNAE